jgi:hypothetical protein
MGIVWVSYLLNVSSSHRLKPLDVGVFGPLNPAYGKLVEEIMLAGNSHIDKEVLK